jgi:hypothetical protein
VIAHRAPSRSFLFPLLECSMSSKTTSKPPSRKVFTLGKYRLRYDPQADPKRPWFLEQKRLDGAYEPVKTYGMGDAHYARLTQARNIMWNMAHFVSICQRKLKAKSWR